MPQEFHVLRCFACHLFQVHQTKKDKKWTCKVCAEKQSLKKAYFLGAARDCRSIVQKLNMESEGGKFENELSQFDEHELTINDPKEDSNLEPVLADCTNREENPNESNCYPPLKKQRFNNSSFSMETEVEPLLLKKSYPEPEAIDQPDNIESSAICFDIGLNIDNIQHTYNFDNRVVNQDSGTDSTSCGYKTEKPQIPKNRGFQMILKAARKLT